MLNGISEIVYPLSYSLTTDISELVVEILKRNYPFSSHEKAYLAALLIH